MLLWSCEHELAQQPVQSHAENGQAAVLAEKLSCCCEAVDMSPSQHGERPGWLLKDAEAHHARRHQCAFQSNTAVL